MYYIKNQKILKFSNLLMDLRSIKIKCNNKLMYKIKKWMIYNFKLELKIKANNIQIKFINLFIN